jgi:adenine-specific DNA-methyltransferase
LTLWKKGFIKLINKNGFLPYVGKLFDDNHKELIQMSKQFDKLIVLLKELFQLDQPDLDFGLYRIMHAKSDEITKFLKQDLLPQVKEAFSHYTTADKAELEKELKKAIEQAISLGADPETIPKVQELRQKLANESVDVGGLESEVYDHLYRFFRRYYHEGDFLPKRVYKPGVYAIPYEGEEVKLHWANQDQYYIKSSEFLRNYTFMLQADNEADPMRVHFRLADAKEGEHGSVKSAEDKERVFLLLKKDFISEEKGELIIAFEYRSATPDDWSEEGLQSATAAANKKPPSQKELLADAVRQVLSIDDLTLKRWIDALSKKHVKVNGEIADHTRLEGHLNRYSARSTFDYFIHKGLGGFLRRELDFYIKNEVMHLDDVENESAHRVEQYLSKIKVIRKVAHKLTEFLAQLEDFQKKLWLKKKFVVETNYCITLDRIPEEFYPKIAANEAQREEWVTLFAIDEIKTDLTGQVAYSEPLSVGFLKTNLHLVLDTQFFEEVFKTQIIDSIDSFDEECDGFLIHSENFQALNLIQAKYRHKVNGIYIDPPYNTNATEIIYKNGYKHSSWASLMNDRIDISKSFLKENGITCTTIDDYEVFNLALILKQNFQDCDLRPVIIEYNHRGRVKSNFAITHEYALWTIPRNKDLITRQKDVSDDIRRNLRRTGTASKRSESPSQFYGIEVNKESLKIISVTDALPISESIPDHINENTIMVWPVDDEGVERRWYYGKDRIMREAEAGTVWAKVITGKIQIHYWQAGKEKRRKSVWVGSDLDASTFGSELLNELFGLREFDFPKSIHAVQKCLEAISYDDDAVYLDYFSGSGTTGHAAIKLNRELGGKRKYILVEAGEHFDVVTKPRIQKVVYSKDWKDGKPISREGISHTFKYIRLESYEDTLNNLIVMRDDAQRHLLGESELSKEGGLKEEFILRYMLNAETQGSQSLLNISAFKDPTAYKLKVKRPGSDESCEVNVDLLETFNYLIGLTVRHLAVPQTFQATFKRDEEKRLRLDGRLKQEDSGPWWFRTVTGNLPDGRNTLVIWRKLTGEPEQDNLVLDEWFTRQGYSTKDYEFDLIYVNGDSNLENLRQSDETWKVRVIEEDFHRLMFEIESI